MYDHRPHRALHACRHWTDEQLTQRFDMIEKAGVRKIAVWMIPIDDRMWSYISKWYYKPT